MNRLIMKIIGRYIDSEYNCNLMIFFLNVVKKPVIKAVGATVVLWALILTVWMRKWKVVSDRNLGSFKENMPAGSTKSPR